MNNRLSFEYFRVKKKKAFHLQYVYNHLCLLRDCIVLQLELFFTTYAYEREKPERNGPNVKPLGSKYLLFFHDAID